MEDFGMASTAKPRYIVVPVECSDCHAKHVVHVAAPSGPAQFGDQVIACKKCEKPFSVMVPDTIIDGPFLQDTK
jgi:hypothetical protein